MSFLYWQVVWDWTTPDREEYYELFGDWNTLLIGVMSPENLAAEAYLPIWEHLCYTGVFTDHHLGWLYLVEGAGTAAPAVSALHAWNCHWVIDVLVRSAQPAGYGQFEVAFRVTCYGEGDAVLSQVAYTVPVAGWLDTITAAYLLSQPWPDRVDGHLPHALTGSLSSLAWQLASWGLLPATTIGTDKNFQVHSIISPCEGNLATSQDGTQWLARRPHAEDLSAIVVCSNERIYRRDTYGTHQLWTRCAHVGGYPSLLPQSRLWLTTFTEYYALGAWTIDRGATFTDLGGGGHELLAPLDHDRIFTVPVRDVHWSARDNLTGYVATVWDGSDQLWAIITDTSGPSSWGPTLVTNNCRTDAETGCLPRPAIWSQDDGSWAIGALCGGGNYREWQSNDPFGETWTLIEEQTLGTWANLDGAIFAFGRDRSQVCVGYTAAGQLTALVRGGRGDQWRLGGTIGDQQPLAPPYLFQRPDGVWECGWLEAATGLFYAYTADDPAGTWWFLSAEPALEET